jgi:hypothetical protein
MIRGRSILSAFALSLCIGAGAQLPPGISMPSLWYNPVLLMDPGVQKELKLSQAASNNISGIIISEAMKMGPAAMSMMGGKAPSQADASRKAPLIQEGYVKMQKACTDNMNATQLERLHQITLQSFGPMSLLDPKIGSQVGLTPAQENKLQSELTKLAAVKRASVSKMFSNGMKPDPAAQAASKAKSDALLNTVLTAKQRAKWKALQGKPYQLTGIAAIMGGG